MAVKAAPWAGTDLPGLAEIHQAFAEADPGVEVNAAHVSGWVSAKTFELAAKNLPDKPTNEDVLTVCGRSAATASAASPTPSTFPLWATRRRRPAGARW